MNCSIVNSALSPYPTSNCAAVGWRERRKRWNKWYKKVNKRQIHFKTQLLFPHWVRVGLVSMREYMALLNSCVNIVVSCLARVYCLCHVLFLYYRIVLSLVYSIVTYRNWFVGVYIFCVKHFILWEDWCMCAVSYFLCEGEAIVF